MAKPRPVWLARRPRRPLPYTFFISHASEDNEAVQALATEIRTLSSAGGRLPLMCYLDVESWEIGNDNLGVIKDSIPKCEYMVLWATPSYVANTRGWVWMELAYAEILEASQNPQVNIRFPYIVPVFQGVTADMITRTPLLNYWQRRLFDSGEEHSIKEVARKLMAFHVQETAKRGGIPE